MNPTDDKGWVEKCAASITRKHAKMFGGSTTPASTMSLIVAALLEADRRGFERGKNAPSCSFFGHKFSHCDCGEVRARDEVLLREASEALADLLNHGLMFDDGTVHNADPEKASAFLARLKERLK